METIVSLLPSEKNTTSCSFLFGLLRTAIILDTTIACRLDLEKRIGMQLEQATLDDLLIPSFSYTGDTLFDNDIVHRIVVNFLQQDDSDDLQVHLCTNNLDSLLSSVSLSPVLPNICGPSWRNVFVILVNLVVHL